MKVKQKKQYEQTINKFHSAIAELNEIASLMPTRSNTPEQCQKNAIRLAIKKLEDSINGIELGDFEPNEYSGDFEFSYT